MSTLVAYFSAEYGKTKGIAEEFSKGIGADIFEIVPKEPYTKADLRYMNPLARCNREKIGKGRLSMPLPLQGEVESVRRLED